MPSKGNISASSARMRWCSPGESDIWEDKPIFISSWLRLESFHATIEEAPRFPDASAARMGKERSDEGMIVN